MQARSDRADINFLNNVIMVLNQLKTDKSKKEDIRNIALAVYHYAGQPLKANHMESILNGNVLFPNIADIDTSLKTAPVNFYKFINDIQAILAKMHTSFFSSNSLKNQIRALLSNADDIVDNLIQLSNAQNQNETEQSRVNFYHNRALPIVGDDNHHRLLEHIFSFFTPLESRKTVPLVSRDWFAVSNDTTVLKEQMKHYFNLSDEQLDDELKANNESLAKTMRQLEQTRGRTFVLMPSAGGVGINQNGQLHGLDSYMWYWKGDHSATSSSDNFWLSKIFANPCYPTIQTARAAYLADLTPSAKSPGTYVILELQLPLEKTSVLLKEKKFEELATHARKAYTCGVVSGISSAISIEYTDKHNERIKRKQFIQRQKPEEQHQDKPANNTPRKR